MPFINEQIIYPRVQTIDRNGENVGVISRTEALRMAQESGLDLVLLAEKGSDGVPVVKVMDFGKVLYERKKKKAESKKHQKTIQVKEIKIRPKIEDHDYQTKIKQAIGFLKEGKRVKITLCFRGRENVLKDMHGGDLFDKINKSFEEHGLLKSIIQEKDMRLGQTWSRIYYLKTTK